MKSIPLSWSGPEESKPFPALITECVSGRPQPAAVCLSLQDVLSQTGANFVSLVLTLSHKSIILDILVFLPKGKYCTSVL